ncbi:transcriptional regulator, HxlR family [Leptospira inadai serovar Lyme str. 10]|uniref:Transcriptional regulator, HxlR family n=2 Tax=Leptospira inadai serovar Lyme TaxID=293084 RepID=V6HF08_9LEPT|nr:helix-turn-helix domain-containing protein [Leptospira inadai]EQA38797.1 transcriptional regulator, HxlR family [Leptospira inadai serovar Lyme str. 10]PNV74078.1 transcriptional regulator [Leptospira inadai serovar Lyme]
MIELNKKTFTCPVDVALSFFAGKWKILILSHLYHFKNKSYKDIKTNLPGISEKILVQQLKELEGNKLLNREIISERPLRVEYSLTEFGRSLAPLFEFLSEWGIGYLKKNGIDYIQDQHLYK